MEKQHWEKIVKDASKKEMYVQFSILTFEDWREQPDEVIRCLERSRRGFAADKYPELKFYYGVDYTNGRLNIGEHTERRWSNIQKRLKADEVNSISLFKDNESYTYPLSIVFVGQVVEDQILRDIQFYISPDMMNESSLKEIRDWFKELFVQFGGVYGYMDFIHGVSIASTFNRTPYEIFCQRELIVHEEDVKEMARGYFWGNILTEGHIALLGGEKEFLAHVPHYLLEKLPMRDGRTAYYVQLEEDIFDFHPNKYLELKDYLQPVLPLKENLKRVIYDSLKKPDILIKNRLVFHEEEIEQTRREMEAKGELQKIMAFINKTPVGEGQEMVSYSEVDRILESSTETTEVSPPVEVKKPPYIEYEERGEGWDASCLGITFVFEELKDDQFEELKEMIQSWFWLGYLGGYGGVFSAYLTDIWHEGNAAGTMVDIAGCPEEEAALKILERSVNGFAWEKGLTLQQMILGEYDDAQPDE